MAVKNQTKGHQLCVATPKIEVTREELYFFRQKCDGDDHVCENTCTSRCNAASKEEEEEAKSAIFIAFCAARATCN